MHYTFDEDTMQIRKKVCYPDGTPRGRKRDMSPVGCLGLVLMWYRTTGACSRNLALHFGQTCKPMYRWLKFGRRILLKILMNDDDANLQFPSMDKLMMFCDAVNDKYPVLSTGRGAMDVLKI